MALTAGSLAKLLAGSFEGSALVLQIASMDKSGKKIKVTLTDGVVHADGVLTSQLVELVNKNELRVGTTIKLSQQQVNTVNERSVVMITELEVLGQDALATPVGVRGERNILKESNLVSPGPAPSPSEDPKSKVAKTDMSATPSGTAGRPSATATTPGYAHGTPPGLTPKPTMKPGTPVQLAKSGAEKKVHKLEQLHPYEDTWTIKCKVSNKSPLWSAKGHPKFSVDLIDAGGRQIQGTFWHAQAEKYHDIIEVDKVYVFSKFQVKVANKAYASVANDYEIHFSDKTEVTEAADQEASGMTAALDLVPFDELLKHVTRKAPVDVIGVVIGLGPMGSIKRKSSGDEVSKRDVTIVDNGGKSISLTLWNETATRESLALEDWETRCVVLQITNCKVSDFQGCSLSSLSKSKMTVDPETDAARTLKNWWDALTTSERAGFPTVGDASARGSGAGRESRALSYLSAVADAAKESDLPSPDVKPSYHDVVASASLIKTDQTLYYMAHPETGRKVVEQSNGSFISESDGKVCDKPQPRYVFQFKLVDATGEVWTNIFGGEAEALLGCTADELVAQKSESEESVEARIKAAQWNEWAITVSSRTRDYNGERKMRHTVMALKPVDYAKESRRLLDLISRY